MDYKTMEWVSIRGNTWVLKSWVMIPVYQLDDHRCILLDNGVAAQRQDLDRALAQRGLTCVGVLGSHAHLDHAGNTAYLQKKGAKVAMSLGEAGMLATSVGMCTLSGNSPGQVRHDQRYAGMEFVPDQLIWPQDTSIQFCGATFGIVHTPGHTQDHICIRTPDDVLYLGDAMMAGPELYHAKFPYAVSIADYFHSMVALREERAAHYLVAHYGIFSQLRPLVDLALHHLAARMQEILTLLEEPANLWQLTDRICRTYHARADNVVDLTYFYRATQSFAYYLVDRGEAETYVQDNNVVFRRTQASLAKKNRAPEFLLPPTGQFH